MTDPKTPGTGGDGATNARPELLDKAKDVLARGTGAAAAAKPAADAASEVDEKTLVKPVVKPVVKGAPAAKPAGAPVPPPAPAAGAPAKAPVDNVDEKTNQMKPVRRPAPQTEQPTEAMPRVTAPVAPAVPERPLFADTPRGAAKPAPTKQSAETTTATAVSPAVAVPPVAAGVAAPKSRPNTRKARLRLTKVDPWSVMKTSFLLSLAFGVVLFVAVAMIWLVLGAAGVWDSVNEAVKNFDEGTTFNITDYLGTSRVLGLAALVAVVDVVLMTALATLTAFLYNMSASLLGGVELTFTEER